MTSIPPERIFYKKLDPKSDTIRLIEIQPAKTIKDPIVCRLVSKRLSRDLDYVGLSALFGDQNTQERITVDELTVSIPVNLAEALRHVRAVFQEANASVNLEQSPSPAKKSPDWLMRLLGHAEVKKPSPVLVWLDALCINRRDERELARQMSTMKRAYGAARMVVGWLGLKDDTSDHAVETIQATDKAMPANFGDAEDRRLHPENYAPHYKYLADIAFMWDMPAGSDPRNHPVLVAMTRFFGREYFQRDWILRELTLARFPAFLVGDRILSWRQVLRFNRNNEELSDNSAELVPDEYRKLLGYLPLGSINTLLREFDRRREEDRRPDSGTSFPNDSSSASFISG